MESFAAANVNTLSSFETERLPPDFFVDYSPKVTISEIGLDQGRDYEYSFPIHRKLLRRRHVRKLQKTRERERQRKEEEQKLKELTRDRDQKRRVEKKRSLHDNKKISKAKSRTKRTFHSTEVEESGNLIASPAQVRGEYYTSTEGTKINIPATFCASSPTSVLGLHRNSVSSPTKSPPPLTLLELRPAVSSSPQCGALITGSTRYMECRSSFSLPEFSPVRPTKFRRLEF